MGQAVRPPTQKSRSPHSLCGLCSHAHFGSATTARVSSPKRLFCPHWLARVPDMVISWAPPRLGAPFSCFWSLFTEETWIGNFGDDATFAIADLVVCFNACFTSCRAHSGLLWKLQVSGSRNRQPEQVKCCHDTDCNESMMKKDFTALKHGTWKKIKRPSRKR